MKQFTYLFIDLGCILLPLLCSFIPYRAFYKEWRYFMPANLLVAFLFIVWDYVFTDLGIWGFNPDYLTGIYLGNLPLEEVLFFICIPYACTFGYFALTYYLSKNDKPSRIFQLLLASLLLIIGLFNLKLAYTSVTFISLAAYLYISTALQIKQLYPLLSYSCVIPFFFLANGLLTGSFLEAPIVWYNDAENLGIRLTTIPVEDIFYGMMLVLMNINLYEFLKKRLNA